MSKMLQSFSPESDGYQFMWIILVVFMIGLGFSIERVIYIMVKSSKGRKDFLAKFGTHISAQRYDDALSFANSSNLPIAKVMAAIVAARNGGRETMAAACDAVFLTEAPRLTRYISIIQVMASISTLLGLMGTIYGLIYTFDLGLLSAVPLLVLVGLLNMNSERLIQEMEEKGLKIINSLA